MLSSAESIVVVLVISFSRLANGLVLLDNETDASVPWVLSRPFPKWFEYYSDSDALSASAADPTHCPYIISSAIDQLDDVNGIWVACQDPVVPEGCQNNPTDGCHPELKYNDRVPKMRDVKIWLWVSEFAVVRLAVSGTAKNKCFDFARRRDPFSPCQFIDVTEISESGWIRAKPQFDDHESMEFTELSVRQIARFKGDVALIDKIEINENPMCDYDDGEAVCTTTTTIRPRPTTTLKPGEYTILETEDDTVDNDDWTLPNTSPLWFEYYDNTAAIIDPGNNIDFVESCAYIVQSAVPTLPLPSFRRGIWSSCGGYFLSHPVIQYTSKLQNVTSIRAYGYLHGKSARIRLNMKNGCIDFSLKKGSVPGTACTVQKVSLDYYGWHELSWKGMEQLTEFSMELITESREDFILLDKVIVNLTPAPISTTTTTSSSTTDVMETETITEFEDVTTEDATTVNTMLPSTRPTTTVTDTVTKVTIRSSTPSHSTILRPWLYWLPLLLGALVISL